VCGKNRDELVILPGITMLWMWNTSGEWLFCQELPCYGCGIHQRNGYSARNYHVMDVEYTREIVILPGITML
jgi:hypothetical protein